MSSDFKKFLENAKPIEELKTEQDEAGPDAPYRYVTAREAAVFYPAGTDPALMTQKIFKRYNNNRAGQDAWERDTLPGSIARQAMTEDDAAPTWKITREFAKSAKNHSIPNYTNVTQKPKRTETEKPPSIYSKKIEF